MKRGQALVEFVIILPIFLMLVLSIVDIGNILISKMNLENELTDIITIYRKNKSINDIKIDNERSIKLEPNGNNMDFTLGKEITIITPGLNLILHNPYTVEVSRSIYVE